MKKIKSIQLLLVSAFSLTVIFSSCKKDKIDVVPISTTGSLEFHIHTMADTAEVDAYDDTIIMTGGRQITLSTAQLYISNIKLIKTDGTVVDGPSTTLLMKQGTEVYDLGTVDVGNYKSVRFDLGLSDAVDAAIPSSSNSTLYQTSMWFMAMEMTHNYVYVNFQGTIDTTAAANGTDLIPFSYKIGTTAHRVTITMPDQAFSVSPDQQSVVHMMADYAKLLNGFQLNVASNLNVNTAGENSGSLANQIAANMANMMVYE